MVDATCPFVKRAQDIIKKISDEDCRIIIVGESTHPEVVGLVSYGKGKCIVVENKDGLRGLELPENVSVVSQTTQTPENFAAVLRTLKRKNVRVRAYNTICRATIDRQSEAGSLARRVDVMIVVGGKNSGNTRRLAEISAGATTTHLIETAAELRPRWFAAARQVGITAGASTPDWIIREVKDTIECMTAGKQKFIYTGKAGVPRRTRTAG
jgi:4-hydroxy-3-methylbut-2-enyl diphosphate reductase